MQEHMKTPRCIFFSKTLANIFYICTFEYAMPTDDLCKVILRLIDDPDGQDKYLARLQNAKELVKLI